MPDDKKLIFLDLKLAAEPQLVPTSQPVPSSGGADAGLHAARPPREGAEDYETKLLNQAALKVWRDNEEKYRLYHALRHALPKYFCLCEGQEGQADPELVPADMNEFGCTTDKDLGDKAIKRVSFITMYGMMLADNLSDPLLGRASRFHRVDGDETYPGTTNDPKDDFARTMAGQFKANLVDRVKLYKSNQEVFEALHPVLVGEGQPQGDNLLLKARHWAVVGRRLIDQGIRPSDPNFKRHALNALTEALGGALQGRAASTDINLPDLDVLDAQSAADIDADNVAALSAIYFAAMLEDMKLFAVADKVAEQFISGMLPVKRGLGGQRIYDYMRSIPDRFTELDRRSLYSRTFGISGGGVEEELPNREFADIWVRALSAVSLFNRQVPTEKQLVSAQQVHKTFRDLGVNLSLHGYGLAHFGAVELQKLINDVLEMLKAPDVLASFGVKDVWQLVDRVSTLYLGGSTNGVRLRTMAQSGARIIQYISKNSATLSSPFANNLDALFKDKELTHEAERWLAVTGTTDSTVEEYSEPVVAPTQPTIPTMSFARMPQQLDDALNQVGNLGVPVPVGQA